MRLCRIPPLSAFASLSVLPAEAELRGKKAIYGAGNRKQYLLIRFLSLYELRIGIKEEVNCANRK
jgi:hypothetical protein